MENCSGIRYQYYLPENSFRDFRRGTLPSMGTWQPVAGPGGDFLSHLPPEPVPASRPSELSFRPDFSAGEMLLSEMETAWGRDDGWALAPIEGDTHSDPETPSRDEETSQSQEDLIDNLYSEGDCRDKSNPGTSPAANACSNWSGEKSERPPGFAEESSRREGAQAFPTYSREFHARLAASSRRALSCVRERISEAAQEMSTSRGAGWSSNSAEHLRSCFRGSPCKRSMDDMRACPPDSAMHGAEFRPWADASIFNMRGTAHSDNSSEGLSVVTRGRKAGKSIHGAPDASIPVECSSSPKRCRVLSPKPHGVLITSPLTLHKALAAHEPSDMFLQHQSAGTAFSLSQGNQESLRAPSFPLPRIFRPDYGTNLL